MKNFVLAVAFLCTALSFSQNSRHWQTVDSLELQGRIESASDLVAELLETARKKKNYEQLIKAKIFQYKFYQVNNEDSDQFIFNDLNKTLNQLPLPYWNVLMSYKAEFLQQYYLQHRWKIGKRTEIDNPNAKDLTTWSEVTLQDSIRSSYEYSLQNRKKLISIPVERIAELLQPEPLNRKYQPTIYDLLAHRALNYFSDSSNFSAINPEEEFDYDTRELFGTTKEFQQLKFPEAAQQNPKVEVLKIMQFLEALHSEEKDPTARVHVQLKRLDYLHSRSQKWQKYTQALDKLILEYNGTAATPLVLYARALAYFEQAKLRGEEEELLHPDFNKKAVELGEKIIKEYPGTEMEQKAFSLISAIKAVHLDIQISEYLIPGNTGRMLLSYKSIDSVKLQIFKVPANFSKQKNWYNKQDEIQEFVETKTALSKKSILLPRAEDFNAHSTEVLIPPLERGTYLLFVSGQNSFERKGFNFGFLKVTNLTLSQTSFENKDLYRSLNRGTGLPEENVVLHWVYKGNIDRIKSTNKEGEVLVNQPKNLQRLEYIQASKDGDTLISNFYGWYYRETTKKKVEQRGKTMLYLDRAIYRPGQKVHFKGVLLSHENGETKTVPNEFVEIYVQNPNAEEIETFRLKTNKFGSFNGEFLLPKSGITGIYQIYTEEDTEADSPFWDKILENDSYIQELAYFNVEEYKRPTFEVTFDTINRSFSFGDSVILKGNALAFMGAPVTNVSVKYTVKRREVIYRWWYYDRGDFISIRSDSVNTDEKGDFSLSFPAEIAVDDRQKKDLLYEYSIEATVTDISGETRTSTTSLKIGKKNLLLKLDLPESIQRGDSLQPKILATNLNDITVPVSGSLKIYKLRGPDRVLGKRLWPGPEIQTISKEDFEKFFPEEPYKNIPEPMEWHRELVFEASFETDGSYEPKIPILRAWKTGKYLAMVGAESGDNKATSKKTFDVNDPTDRILPDNQRFTASLLTNALENEKIVKLLLQTGYTDLHLHVGLYDNEQPLYSKFVHLNGNRLLEIPLENTISEELQIQITGVKNNAAIHETLKVLLPKTEDFLKITTQTFRSKLQPGVEETWSFKIENSAHEAPEAEVLASMYDMSLDQFAIQEWKTDPRFARTYNSFPSYTLPNIGSTTVLYNKFPSPWRYRFQKRNFDRLHLFGFVMSVPNSYQYRNYLRNKKEESDKLVGNTRGKVTDEEGFPIPGVNVIIDGTNTGTITNFEGEFAISTKIGDQLVFSYLGYHAQSVLIGKNREIYIILSTDSTALEEIVVTGDAEIQEEAEAIQKINPGPPLQGRVAGLAYTSYNTIQIRGASSASEKEGLLYIIDGKFITDDEIPRSDILSIKVLTPEEAMALYGSRAANGAVVISTKEGLEELQNVTVRKDLDETAFFYPDLKLGEDGKLEFSFTSPEALTQWKFRLMAHTTNWITGSYQNTTRTQKELSVMPNPPRFVRETDTIVFKTKISNLSSETMTGTAMLQFYDALTMKPIDSLLGNLDKLKNFSIATSGNTSVSWNLTIPEGVQALTYKIVAKAGDFSDGEENFLPVLSNRILVKESLPFFVRAGETETYVFEKLQENTSNTLAHHKYTLEYSSNPAWYALQSLPYLIESTHPSSEQTFARLYANAVASKIMNSQPKIKEVFEAWQKDSTLISNLQKNEELKNIILAETPWVRDAASETAQKQLLGQLLDSERLQEQQDKMLLQLKQMQKSSGGWSWFPGGEVSPFITRYIVAGLGHLDKLEIELENSEITKKAITYLDRAVIKEWEESRKKEQFYNSHYLLHYLYARSFYLEKFQPSQEIRKLITKTIAANKEDWLQKDLYNKGLLMMVLIRTGEKEFASKIGQSLQEMAVKSKDQGMYWKENISGWYWYRAPVETQALLIEGFSELGEDEIVEELKIWLLQNKRTNHWPTTKATTEATYALLMRGKDWLQVEDQTLLQLGGEPVAKKKLLETKKEAGTGYRKLVWKAEEITEDFGKITVVNNNSIAGYGGAYWQYFEEVDKIIDHGTSPLNIEKELYLNVSGSNGTTLQQITPRTILQLGDLVTVRLVVRTTADMEFIHLKDMRASGFEPTNVLSEYKYQDGTAYYESTRDAATHFFFDILRKGTYVLEYTVKANNAGKFSNGITIIESMYAPEFSGHTKGSRVEIR